MKGVTQTGLPPFHPPAEETTAKAVGLRLIEAEDQKLNFSLELTEDSKR